MSIPVQKAATDPFLSAFEEFEKSLAGQDPPWVHLIRRSGIAHFSEQGLPTVKHEEWRYTNVAPIAKLPFRPVLQKGGGLPAGKTVEDITFVGLKGPRLVFVDGHFAPDLSQIGKSNGLQVGSLAEATRTASDLVRTHLSRYARSDENAFVALNTAFLQDGAFIHLAPGQSLPDPVHVVFVNTAQETGSAAHPRTLIVASDNSQARIIEHYVSLGDAPALTNAVNEIVVGENAQVEHCKVQSEGLNIFHVATVQSHQSGNSRLISHSISTGAKLSRNNINMVFGGEGIDSILNGLYLAKDDQLVDHHTVADHRMPHCQSHEFYHGILDGRSRGIFNGKIFVRKDAQKTDAKQTNKNLLLSDEASIDTKPQLEIHADDVKCTHGATVGQLDEESIFYLRSRGLSLDAARRMLIHAFASDILNRITIEPVRLELDRVLFGRIEENLNVSTVS